jgi:hypothetical protein
VKLFTLNKLVPEKESVPEKEIYQIVENQK